MIKTYLLIKMFLIVNINLETLISIFKVFLQVANLIFNKK